MQRLYPIPMNFYCWDDYGTEYVDEPFVSIRSLNNPRLVQAPHYHNDIIARETSDIYIREGVADRLLRALSLLPCPYGFMIFDGWRSPASHEALFEALYSSVMRAKPGMRHDAAFVETAKFVPAPSLDLSSPPSYLTGGGLDLTIYHRSTGVELEMGTDFEELDDKSHTAYFERFIEDGFYARDSRRLLYAVMARAGFSNQPTAWWHYDYGNISWARFTGKPERYRGEVRLPALGAADIRHIRDGLSDAMSRHKADDNAGRFLSSAVGVSV